MPYDYFELMPATKLFYLSVTFMASQDTQIQRILQKIEIFPDLFEEISFVWTQQEQDRKDIQYTWECTRWKYWCLLLF